MAVSTVVSVVLEEADIPGASLDEPLDSHNMASLRWWLQCHGIKPITSWKKQELISRSGKVAAICSEDRVRTFKC